MTVPVVMRSIALSPLHSGRTRTLPSCAHSHRQSKRLRREKLKSTNQAYKTKGGVTEEGRRSSQIGRSGLDPQVPEWPITFNGVLGVAVYIT